MFRRIVKILTAAVFLMLGVTPVFSQSESGKIAGQVTDPQGLAVPNAKVEIINQETSAKRETNTDETGHWAVSDLPPGRYKVAVEVPGFAAFLSEDVTVGPGQLVASDAKLSVTQEKASVRVEGGGAGQIETSNAGVSGTINETEAKTLGLNGIVYQLIALVPGVSDQTGQDEGKTGVAGSAKYSVDCRRVEYNIFEVDGTDVLNNGINAARGANTFIVNPSVDATGEMKVLTSNYGAMYGETASGIVQISTKSGTSQFPGDGYEFIRNEFFNARNFFDQPGKAPLYRRNDFGFTLSGPDYIPGKYDAGKQKTFFFFSQEFRYEKTPVAYNQAEAFNIFNHTQFGIYDLSHPGNTGNNVIGCYGGASAHYSAAGGGVDCLTGNSFLHPVDAHDPRILQFGLKFAFQRLISGYADMGPERESIASMMRGTQS